MGEEVPKEPPEIRNLQEARKTLVAPPYPNNGWKVFSHLKRSLIRCKEFLGALLGLARRPRLCRGGGRRSGLLEHRVIRGPCRLVRRRMLRLLCRTLLILRSLSTWYRFFSIQAILFSLQCEAHPSPLSSYQLNQ